MTRCKFRCDRVITSKHWDKEKDFLYGYEFTPVMGDTPENKAFWAASPSGSFTLNCVHAKLFEPGKEYYLDISEA